LYVLDVPDALDPAGRRAPGEQVRAWQPRVGGIREVFHAHFTEHAYPMHAHDSWTLMIIDEGAVRYHLGGREHGALRESVTLLPPHVPHDGESAWPEGFRKRVLYLETPLLGEDLIGPNVGTPTLADPLLRHRVHQLHRALGRTSEDRPEPWELDSRLVLIRDRLDRHLRRHHHRYSVQEAPEPRLARDLRDLLDASLPDGLRLDEAASVLHAPPSQLVRSFRRLYGMPPHRYLLGRKVDLARRLLLDGAPPAQAASASGFYDQAHLNRHFKHVLGVTPGRFASAV
jgi:AraC-like DNA-binding protein